MAMKNRWLVFVAAAFALLGSLLGSTAVMSQQDSGSERNATRETKTAPREAPTVDPPQILVAEAIDDRNQLVLVGYHSIFIGFTGEAYNERILKRVSLEGASFRTAAGDSLTIEAAKDYFKGSEKPIVVTAYGMEVPEFYRAIFVPTTLHIAFAKEAPQWKAIEAQGARLEK